MLVLIINTQKTTLAPTTNREEANHEHPGKAKEGDSVEHRGFRAQDLRF
jgi:hypothetical protein